MTATWTVSACCSCCPKKRGVITAAVFPNQDTIDPNPDNNEARLEIRFIGKFPF